MAILLNPVYVVLAALLLLGLVLIRLGSQPQHAHAHAMERMPTAAPEPTTPLTMASVMATLNQLAAQRDRGEITQGDFDGQKASLLARL